MSEEFDHTYKFPGVEVVSGVLLKYNGNVKRAAEALGVCRNTLSTWIGQYKGLQQARKTGNETRLDLAEEALDDLVKKRDRQSVFFLLRALGKERGYVINNQPAPSDGTASHWAQLHEMFEQARREFNPHDDPQKTEPVQPGPVGPDHEVEGGPELGPRPGS